VSVTLESATITIENIDYDIMCDELPVTHNMEMLEINTGETREEFETRRNSLGRWFLGLPKKRKEGEIVHIPVRVSSNPLTIFVKEKDDLNFFVSWMNSVTSLIPSEYKKDCLLLKDGSKLLLRGSFVTEYNFDLEEDGTRKIVLTYDCYEDITKQ